MDTKVFDLNHFSALAANGETQHVRTIDTSNKMDIDTSAVPENEIKTETNLPALKKQQPPTPSSNSDWAKTLIESSPHLDLNNSKETRTTRSLPELEFAQKTAALSNMLKRPQQNPQVDFAHSKRQKPTEEQKPVEEPTTEIDLQHRKMDKADVVNAKRQKQTEEQKPVEEPTTEIDLQQRKVDKAYVVNAKRQKQTEEQKPVEEPTTEIDLQHWKVDKADVANTKRQKQTEEQKPVEETATETTPQDHGRLEVDEVDVKVLMDSRGGSLAKLDDDEDDDEDLDLCIVDSIPDL
jgi:hypothetical protein